MDIPLNVSHILDILSNYPKHWVTQIIWSEFRGGRYKYTVSVSERARACVRVCVYIYMCVCVKETCTPDFHLGLFSWKTFFLNVLNTDPYDKCRFKKMCILSLRNDILAMCCFYIKKPSNGNRFEAHISLPHTNVSNTMSYTCFETTESFGLCYHLRIIIYIGSSLCICQDILLKPFFCAKTRECLVP